MKFSHQQLEPEIRSRARFLSMYSIKVLSIYAKVLEIIVFISKRFVNKKSIYLWNLKPSWKTYKSVTLFILETYLSKLFDRNFDEKLFDII